MATDPRIALHQTWLGMIQPVGLFLAPRVLADADAVPTDDAAALTEHLTAPAASPLARLAALCGWTDDLLRPVAPLTLDGGIELAADAALHDLDTDAPVLVVASTPTDALDAALDDPRWTASPHQRFERLLRAGECPVGVLASPGLVRVLYAPRGEATAHATWRLADCATTAGRPMLAALHMILHARRLLAVEPDQRLPALLRRSREFQNSVSTRLQAQVLDALQELLDGLQRADRVTDGKLLAPWRDTDDHRQTVYHGLVTALLRTVFVLFAEERRLLPLDAALYRASYALTGLHARLVAAHERHGDGLDARFGAWAQMIALFRMLYRGADAREVPDGFAVPARKGELFDPARFPFLEGRSDAITHEGPLDLPKISDGVVHRVLDRLLVLDGERLKYSDLAVEQIGSVYEGIMGYTLEVAEDRSLRVRVGAAGHGAVDVVIDLQRFRSLSRKDFTKHLTETLGLDLADATKKLVEAAKSADDVQAALSTQRAFKKLHPIDPGWMYLQPGEERRRSGSHYTPRSLTAPIVEKTLRPVLAALGEHPTPEQILSLRVCDPAMGSGAFLVEVCRQLAAALEAAWAHHQRVPSVPPDEDLHLHARRRVAQRCLYGVDRNPLAVELARLSLWLETFARDHAFTFVDHCLRHGDSLVGASLEQVRAVALDVAKGAQLDTVAKVVGDTLTKVKTLRAAIHAVGDDDPPDNDSLRALWKQAQDALFEARAVGDLVVAAFFGQKSDRDRSKWLSAWHPAVMRWLGGEGSGAEVQRETKRVLAEKGVVPFHWALEFPEVFEGGRGGFDAFVGNPPFLGGKRISTEYGDAFRDWLAQLHEGANSNADLVAHFFRRAFSLLRDGGTMGLIATNTIAQGDTRSTGLRWICSNGGTIYDARRRYKWPGVAAVIVTVVHIARGSWSGRPQLDGRHVDEVTAFLFHRGGHESPGVLRENAGNAGIGAYVMGKGFTFDDEEKKRETVNSLAELRALIAKDPRNQERIFPYLGGEELNDDPEQKNHRYVINFGEMSEADARAWPDLMTIVEEKVKPERLTNNRETYRRYWWQFGEKQLSLYARAKRCSRVLANSLVSSHLAFAWLPVGWVYAHTLSVFPVDQDAFFAVMQSRVHEAWARFFGSSMKDDLRYTPSDCFETFPFPPDWENSPALADLGARYHAHRAERMKSTVGTKKPEGLTATYNRFHDRHDRTPAIETLRALHAAMDRAVLDAYGWTDLRPTYDHRVQLDERVRLTWDDDTRDEVLARLLEENRRRAATERAAQAPAATKAPAKGAKGGKKKGDAGPLLPGV